MMEENLVGYVLNALDPEAQREVEGYLRSHPEAQAVLETLRQSVKPLAADRAVIEPPPGLRIRTLARVAEYRCRNLARVIPQAPVVQPSSEIVPSWWRRADVVVAACLLVICASLLMPLLLKAKRTQNLLECQNNLRALHAALERFGDLHEGALPRVEENAPRNFAGVFVPVLYADGLLANVTLNCPGNGQNVPAPISLEQLQELSRTRPAEYARYVRELGGCYAYSLGYRSGDRLVGQRLDPALFAHTPIMADRPPFESPVAADLQSANSQNHGGDGQNVLFLGGEVKYYTARTIGPDGDDIFLNQKGQLDAGLNKLDVVLAASGVRPSPTTSLDH